MSGMGPLGDFPDAIDTVAHGIPPRAAGRRRRLGTLVWWFVFVLGFLYFFLPLIGTFAWSMRSQPLFSAYAVVVDDPQFADPSLLLPGRDRHHRRQLDPHRADGVLGAAAPAPRCGRIIEFVTLLPFVIPPIILVFGLIRTYSGDAAPAHRTRTSGSNVLLVAAYVVLSFPYMYRAVDTGLRAIDVRS